LQLSLLILLEKLLAFLMICDPESLLLRVQQVKTFILMIELPLKLVLSSWQGKKEMSVTLPLDVRVLNPRYLLVMTILCLLPLTIQE